MSTASEANEIGFKGAVGFQSSPIASGGSSSGGTTTGGGSSGITGSIASWPGWVGIAVSSDGWDQTSGEPAIEAAKTPDNQVVIANYPGSGTDEWGRYSTEVGPRYDGDWTQSPTKTGCGYAVLPNWRDGGIVVYRLRNGGFDPIARFDVAELPTLSGPILEDLAAGCKQ